MHTTSTADCVDEFAEAIIRRGDRLFYLHGSKLRPVRKWVVILRYRNAESRLAAKRFTLYRTHHGPIVRAADGKWISAALMNRPVEALEQSFGRTKAHDLASFSKISALAANSTNNTLFADDRGEIGFFAPQFVPLRDDRFDYTKPVDGSDPDTDWRGATPLADLPRVVNPPNGWVYNANDGPWWAAGALSLRRTDFPRYMDQIGANPRTAHALQVLQDRRDFTPQALIQAAYDPHLPAFARLIPDLIAAYDALPPGLDQQIGLSAPMAVLRGWDSCWSVESVATTLAVSWGEAMQAKVASDVRAGSLAVIARIEDASPALKLTALAEVVDRLSHDFGSWVVPWGEINRFQRLDGAIEPRFDDAAPSWPVSWTSSQWGSLAAFGAMRYPGTKKAYGASGNSFVAVVEFGPRVRALAVSAGGVSGDPSSSHFADQSERFARGDLRPVYFYPDELAEHTERAYRPGGEASAHR